MTMVSQGLLLSFQPQGIVHRNYSVPVLYEYAVRRGEANIAAHGPLIAHTGKHTGRSAKDKFVVVEDANKDAIWWGDVNRPFAPEKFNALKSVVTDFLARRPELFVFDGFAGADPAHRIKVRVVTTNAWHCMFAQNMLIRPKSEAEVADFVPDFTILHAPECPADPEVHGTRSETYILVDFAQRCALIGGTHYAGEIKKTVFTVMNKLLPEAGVLSMHCSANYGRGRDDVALFFGLSGTGKTTLSADSERTLIGDDEHGWSETGVFNIEGGCYAKVIDLTHEREPEIYAVSHLFGTILENVVYDPNTRVVDFSDRSLTENTRAAYPVTHLSNMDPGGVAGHPSNIVFLTADAFGVLPPISRLNTKQAMYHFLSGYTAKVAGTEMGVTEPTATFSACFGAPFLPLHPSVYAELLARKIEAYKPKLWLINTGWTGGPYGTGKRISLAYTRRLVRAALGGELDNVATEADPVFGLEIPVAVAGVPTEILKPRATWPDAAAYDRKAAELAAMFAQNFKRFEDHVAAEVVAAGPRIGV